MIVVPLFHSFFYNIAIVFHKPNLITPHNFYGLTLLLLFYFILISIPILAIIETLLRNIRNQFIVSGIWFITLILLSIKEIEYQPYDFGLIIFSIFFSILFKFYAKTKIKLLNQN